MITPADVSAVLVTRGDVDISTILHSLPFSDVVIWDNSERDDLACYGRFAAVAEARNDWIYTQDDDLLVPVAGLLRAWKADDAAGILANKPPAEEWRFLGCGAIFHRDLVASLETYTQRHGYGGDFHRIADVAFAYAHAYRSVWLGYLDFPWQTAANRMYHQPDHMTVRERARERTLALQA